MTTEAHIAQSDNLFTGTDKVLQFTVVDSAGAAQAITGWALLFVMVPWPVTGALASGWKLSKTTGAGITITNGAGGICQVAIADTDTDAIKGNEQPIFYYELRRTDAGNEDVLAYGKVTLRQSAVR